jgi:hypothetical protein
MRSDKQPAENFWKFILLLKMIVNKGEEGRRKSNRG